MLGPFHRRFATRFAFSFFKGKRDRNGTGAGPERDRNGTGAGDFKALRQ